MLFEQRVNISKAKKWMLLKGTMCSYQAHRYYCSLLILKRCLAFGEKAQGALRI